MLALVACGLAAAQRPNQKLACGSCHLDQARTQPFTPMGQAFHFPSVDATLASHPKMAVEKNGYEYTIERQGNQSIYTVSNGKDTFSTPILWDFGQRTETYLYQRNGTYYEALVTYFDRLDGLDTTPGDQAIHPTTLEQAAGRPLAPLEVQRCLGCHTTGAVAEHKLNLDTMQPGITCAHCHRGAVEHQESILEGNANRIPTNLKKLSTEQTTEFCGQCHRTWGDVVSEHLFGVINVRFQPYRLATSKCYDGRDPRISCVACHDPHKNLVREDMTYDKNCLACHSVGAKLSLGMVSAHPGAKTMPICPVAKDRCVSCHMPKTEIPGTHASFADHDIRIVRAGESYPN